MQHKQDVRKELQAKANKKKISRTDANRLYIESMAGKVEHIYRGELPFPDNTNRIGREVLATVGQVMYLYTDNWNKGI